MNTKQRRFLGCLSLLVMVGGLAPANAADILLRDPFERPGMMSTMPEDVSAKADKSSGAVDYSLRAVVASKKKSIALVQDSEGKEYFLNVGDELGGLGVVSSITASIGVSFVAGEETTVLRMPRRTSNQRGL